MRVPVTGNVNQRSKSVATTKLAEKGINLRELSQLLNPSEAQTIENYLMDAVGQLEKREGFTLLHDAVTATAPTMLEKFTDDIYMIGYGTTLAAYTISTGIFTVIKSNFLTGVFSGQRYGNFFFVTNGTEAIGRVDAATLTYATVAGSPIAKVLYTFVAPSGSTVGARLFAGNLSTDASGIHYSDVDTGIDPPFANWTAGTGASSANTASFRLAGDLTSFSSIGSQIIAFYKDGSVGFRITIDGSSGAQVQDVQTDFVAGDFGGERGAINTPSGVFYTNETGVFQMTSGGQTNVPFSRVQSEISLSLGEELIASINFTNADLAFDSKRKLLLVTCARSSTVNNFILVYDTNRKAWSTITGWTISRFLVDGELIFGVDASNVKLYQLFNGFSDNGKTIAAEYIQELNVNSLTGLSSLEEVMIQGQLSTNSLIDIKFDTYDRNGSFTSDATSAYGLQLSASAQANGIGSGGFGSSYGVPYGASGAVVPLANSTGQERSKIDEFSRIILRLNNSDELAHKINFVTLTVRDKALNWRRNNLRTKALPGGTAGGTIQTWLLQTGFWNDQGVWSDTSQWID